MGEHRRGSVLILAIAAACLLVAGIGGYGAYAVLDRDAFADRALHTLDSDEVREEVGPGSLLAWRTSSPSCPRPSR